MSSRVMPTVAGGIILVILLNITSAMYNYTCFGSYCVCLESQCKTSCTNRFCQNKHFQCTEAAEYCSVECNDPESCKNSHFQMASNEFYLHCNADNSCLNITVNCGAEDVAATMQTCGVIASVASINDTLVTCTGNIDLCYLESQSSALGAIIDSEFECVLDHGQCEVNCSGACHDSFYACSTPFEHQCKCNECGQGMTMETMGIGLSSTNIPQSTTDEKQEHVINVDTDTVDANRTINDTEEQKDDDANTPRFNLTDGVITDFEILYYIVLGAGGCLCCCICLCISVVCFVRRSISPSDKKDVEERSKSPTKTPTYSNYGTNSGSIDEEDSGLDLNMSQSDSETKPKPKHAHKHRKERGADEASLSSSKRSGDSPVQRMAYIVDRPQSTARSKKPAGGIKVIYGPANRSDAPHVIDMLQAEDQDSGTELIQRDEHTHKLQPQEQSVNAKQSNKSMNHLAVHSANPKSPNSPMSELSGSGDSASSRDNEEDEGKITEDITMSEIASSMRSISSERNLRSKSEHEQEMKHQAVAASSRKMKALREESSVSSDGGQPQPYPFQAARNQQQLLFARLPRSMAQTQVAAAQRQLFLQQQQQRKLANGGNAYMSGNKDGKPIFIPPPPQQLQMIKPSMRHKHTATPSNQMLPVIDSQITIDPNHSGIAIDDELQQNELQSQSPEPMHRYASSASSHTTMTSVTSATSCTSSSSSSSGHSSTTTDSDDDDEEDDDDDEEESCSCSVCKREEQHTESCRNSQISSMRRQKKPPSKVPPSKRSGRRYSAQTGTSCNDDGTTQCSCPRCKPGATTHCSNRSQSSSTSSASSHSSSSSASSRSSSSGSQSSCESASNEDTSSGDETDITEVTGAARTVTITSKITSNASKKKAKQAPVIKKEQSYTYNEKQSANNLTMVIHDPSEQNAIRQLFDELE